MFRFLFFADTAESLRHHAMPLARYVNDRGWTADAMARAVLDCDVSDTVFRKIFEPVWNTNRFDPRNLLVAANKFRQFVEREEYDVVHIVSRDFSFLSRFALRNLRRLRFPRVVYSVGSETLGVWERIALAWTDHLVVTNSKSHVQIEAATRLPKSRLHLIPDPRNEVLSDASTRAYDHLFGRALDIAIPVMKPNRRARRYVSIHCGSR